jgi:hypothetical protein
MSIGFLYNFWLKYVIIQRNIITNAAGPSGDRGFEWMFVCCVCCVLSGLCDELITSPEESYRPWRVVLCDLFFFLIAPLL